MITQQTEQEIISKITSYHNLSSSFIKKYVKSDEILIGFGLGGSEALVLFIKVKKTSKIIVRKIWNNRTIGVKWNSNGKSVMSPPLIKAIYQIKFLSSIPAKVKLYFPKVNRIEINGIQVNAEDITVEKNQSIKEVICDQNYIPGIEVSRFVEKYSPSPELVVYLYKEVYKGIREIIHTNKKSVRTKPTIELSYLSKILNRLELTHNTIPRTISPLISHKYIEINGIKYLNMFQLISELRKPEFMNILEPKYHCLVSGDTNCENIKITKLSPLLKAMKSDKFTFTYKDIGMKFLDPRAIGFETDGDETIDDYMYDNKPLHNSLGNYDVIHAGHFILDTNYTFEIPKINIESFNDHPFKKPYKNMRMSFKYIMEEGWGVHTKEFLEEDPFWVVRFAFLMGTHFAAMPPFHVKKDIDGKVRDDAQTQRTAIAIYCEGVKWLNVSYLMLHGKIPNFLGVSVLTQSTSLFQADPDIDAEKIIKFLQLDTYK